MLSLIVFLRIHVVQELSLAGFLTLSLAYLVLAVPFFFSGVCLSLLMTHFAARIARIYSADLLGASLGCLGVVVAMWLAPAPHVVAYVATLVAAAAVALAFDHHTAAAGRPGGGARRHGAHRGAGTRHRSAAHAVRQSRGRSSTASTSVGTPSPASRSSPPNDNAAQTLPMSDYARYASPEVPGAMMIDIDGTAWTPMLEFHGDVGKTAFLRESVLYVAHHLRPHADVLIIGIGGGRDVLAAKTFDQRSVLGIEINPLMRHIVQDVYGDYSGRPYTLPGVEVIIDEARSRLSTLPRRFDIIQLSLIDTFSLNAAGGFVFSENYLYTKEAFQEYFRHLTDDGVLSISRYFTEAYPLEILRVAAMVRAAWAAEGVQQPGAHVVVLGQRSQCDRARQTHARSPRPSWSGSQQSRTRTACACSTDRTAQPTRIRTSRRS